MKKKEKPNVLFIICDDLNNAISGMGRTPAAPCPNLNRLMGRSVSFVNAHSNCPMCLPARNSLFSGLYPYTTGHYQLWDDPQTVLYLSSTSTHNPNVGKPLLRDAVMLPRYFKDNGYNTYGAGKVFDPGALDISYWNEFAYGADYGPWLWDAGRRKMRPRPDRLHLYADEPLASYIRRYEGVDKFFIDDEGFRFHIELAFGPLEDLFAKGDGWNCDGTPYQYRNDDDRDPLPDEKTADWIIGKLGQKHDHPFFLAAGFMKPHTPLNAPQKYFDMFPVDEIELPPILKGDTDDCARALVEHRPYGFLKYGMIQKGGEKLYREWLQAYLACTAFVDEQVGKILDALDKSPWSDNTVVVFTSDNGYHMGEKEYIFKDSLWEEGGQVPLIVHAPGISQCDAACMTPVSLIDIYPTLIDLCDLPQNPNSGSHGCPLAGHSLRPLLENPERGEWPGPPVALISVRGDTGIHHSVRSGRYRYTLCNNGEEELYDHATDPHEWRNRASDSNYDRERRAMRGELEKILGKAITQC